MRERRRVTEGIVAAALLSGAPSALLSYRRLRAVRPVIGELLVATRAAGTLLPPGRPGLVRGSFAHLGVSVLYGELLARTLPQRHSTAWGAGAGFAIGLFNLGLVGRRFPLIRELPLWPQLADNVAFGALFALVADREPLAVAAVRTVGGLGGRGSRNQPRRSGSSRNSLQYRTPAGSGPVAPAGAALIRVRRQPAELRSRVPLAGRLRRGLRE